MLRGVEVATVDLIQRVRSKGRHVAIAEPGSEEQRYLDFMQANANVGGEKLDHIILREQPRKIEVLEEFLHGTQHRLGLIDRLEAKGLVAAEIHVKDFMLRHATLYRTLPGRHRRTSANAGGLINDTKIQDACPRCIST